MKKKSFKCKRCSKVFQKRSHLLQHAAVHLLPFACDKCGKRFKRRARLQFHMRVHDPERKKELKCDVCGRAFFDLDTLQKHKKTHEEGKYACNECGERFRRGRDLISHKKQEHKEDSIFVCSECAKVFEDEKRFKRHLTTHTPYEERKYCCDQCGNRFLTKQFLDIQKRTHEERDRSFICKVCGQGFLNAMSLNNHQKTHMKYEDRPAICETCGERFKDNTQLKSHIWYKHTEKETFDCERCGKSHLTEEQLTRHMNRKRPCGERVPCSLCLKTFCNRSQLRVHKQSVHKDIVEFQCPKCEETFESLEEMETHRLTHEDGLTCSVCQQVLYTVNGFNKHMKRHEESQKDASPKKKRGRRPGKKTPPPPRYVCEDCNRTYGSIIKLNEHRLTCTLKKNDESGSLQVPAKISGRTRQKNENTNPDNKVACPLCGKKLAYQSLVKHLRIACPKLEEDFTCKMCNVGKMGLLRALIHVAKCKVNCNETIQCNYCLKNVPASNYPLHIQNEIIKYKLKNPFQLKCKYCSLSLPNKKVLLLHQKMCKPPPIKQAQPGTLNNFICGLCNWTSLSDLDMMNHVKESHSITVTTKSQDKSMMPISSAFSGNKEKTYRFKPIFKCFVCSARFYCPVAGKFHVRCCQKRYGTVTETVNEAANQCEAEQAEFQQDEDEGNVKTSTGVPRLVLVTF